jgi:DNA-binding transcriptional LysR family regulator
MTFFDRLLHALVAEKVDFIVVGGVAATVHGASRLTQDLDVVYSRRKENLGRLVAALAAHHPYLRGAPPGLPFRWDAETLRRGLNFTLISDLGEIDLLGDIPGGGDYEALEPHTVDVMLFGVICKILDLETLIQVKRAAGRPKDFEALSELEALLALRSS